MGTNERQAEHGKTYGWQVAVIPIAFQNAEKPRYPESISVFSNPRMSLKGKGAGGEEGSFRK